MPRAKKSAPVKLDDQQRRQQEWQMGQNDQPDPLGTIADNDGQNDDDWNEEMAPRYKDIFSICFSICNIFVLI